VERIYIFLPSILALACIAGIAFLYLKWIARRLGDNFTNEEWREKNVAKILLTVGAPTYYVFAPAVEELIFRAPLIILFGAMTSFAWYGILISSVLFALMHLLSQEERKKTLAHKAYRFVATFVLSVLAGYYGIVNQSIWTSFGIHVAWNIIAPALLFIFTLLLIVIHTAIMSLWDKTMTSFKSSRYSIH